MKTKIKQHDPDSEAMVIATVLLFGETAVLDVLEANDFYGLFNKIVFAELQAIHKAGEPIEVVALTNNLRSKKNEITLGKSFPKDFSIPAAIAEYVADVYKRPTTAANTWYYAGLLRKYRMLRAVLRFGAGLQSQIAKNGSDPMKTIDWAALHIEKLSDIAKNKTEEVKELKLTESTAVV